MLVVREGGKFVVRVVVGGWVAMVAPGGGSGGGRTAVAVGRGAAAAAAENSDCLPRKN